MKRSRCFAHHWQQPRHARRPRYLKNVANALKKRHITLGMVEADVQLQFIKMDGLVPLSEVMDYDAARVTIAEDEQRRMKVFDAFRRWSLPMMSAISRQLHPSFLLPVLMATRPLKRTLNT